MLSHDRRHRLKPTDVRVTAASLYFLPIALRMPLKFGDAVTSTVTCARVRLRVEGDGGRAALGWGETPLSVQWVWPNAVPFEIRAGALAEFARRLVPAWAAFPQRGHPVEVGHAFLESALPALRDGFNAERPGAEPMPWLAALACCAPFDAALHDAYGVLHGLPVYATYNARYMSRDLSAYLAAEDDAGRPFAGRFPEEYLSRRVPTSLPAWHLVGGTDPLSRDELRDDHPRDGHPVLLEDWIRRDGLTCLKIKLTGTDGAWDFRRIVRVGEMARDLGASWLSADFNCTVKDPAYVNDILDRLAAERPDIDRMVLYVEQPFPYELERHPLDVHGVSARKPLFMDESAHDWRMVRLGRRLGWTGVALKTCKTQTGALLSLCWARAHGMQLMVQDLTNPMLAQIPHVLLAAHADTIMGVETNACQFYPDASAPEARVHPGLYERRGGRVSLLSVRGPGFGYRIAEIERALPEPAAAAGW